MPSENRTDKPKASGLRAYQKPSLIRGPVLTNVTASKTISGGAAPCWVARAAFGETDIRWMVFREWLLNESPAWFRRLYIRHGEMVGSWVKVHKSMQRVARALMMPAVNQILRK